MAGLSIDVTDVDTEAKLPLGYVHVEPAMSSGDYADMGERHWVYVFNDEASTAFAQGTVVMRDAGATTYDAIVTTGAVAPARVIGVAQHAIAAGSYGFVLRKGIGEVLCDGNVSADTAIVPDANAGQATDVAAVTDAAIGIATEADAGAATLVTAILDCRG